ncbi:unnamed protein product, partial [Brassica rapa subsp. narinosa]
MHAQFQVVFKASASVRHGAWRKAHTSSPWSAMRLFKHRSNM